DAYLEIGTKRVLAGAVDWPGWCRGARTEDAALQALVDYTPRHVAAVGSGCRGLKRPGAPTDLRVVQRLKGDATTDFGAPSKAPKADDDPLEAPGRKRQSRLRRARGA